MLAAIYKYRLQITFAIVALVVIFGGYAAYQSIMRAGKVEVEVNILPTNATAMANDTKIRNGKAYLTRGEYTVTVTAEGFKDATQNIKIDPTNHFINVALTAESAEAKAWVSKNKDKYLAFEDASGRQSAVTGKAFKSANPITTHLPYTDTYFTIGYKSPDADTVIVTVLTPSPRYRYEALKQIKNWGYDPSDLTIEFVNYKNPLGY